ncbi:MAG TPA: ATP-binding protein [Candidatus Saccharimonadales bacterium]|nr:ATP-binding protein [Candidatus Saccharimonadales bacterium]
MVNHKQTPQLSINGKTQAQVAKRYPSNEYKAIFETLLLGSFGLVAILSLFLFHSYLFLHNSEVVGRIFVCGAALLYLSATYGAWGRGYYGAASRLLIFFYFGIATFVMLENGPNTTFAQLMLAITIVLSGILLGSRGVVMTAALSVLSMFAIDASRIVTYGQISVSDFGNSIGTSVLLGILALISALFAKHTQELRAKDLQVREELSEEKGALELRVREHSEQVKTMRLEEMEQLYKFAEIGQLSAALLHDIANHLTTLNLDLADLKRQQQTKAVKHLGKSIEYIEQAISQARNHLQVRDVKKSFDVVHCIEDILSLQHFQRSRPYISLNVPNAPVYLYGESLRLSHVLVILVRNALESYSTNTPLSKRTVHITLATNEKAILIRISDHGPGIPATIRKNLFSPLKSTKKDGLGIGLFIAKKIIETHFNGTLQLNEDTKYTEFALTLPKKTGKV